MTAVDFGNCPKIPSWKHQASWLSYFGSFAQDGDRRELSGPLLHSTFEHWRFAAASLHFLGYSLWMLAQLFLSSWLASAHSFSTVVGLAYRFGSELLTASRSKFGLLRYRNCSWVAPLGGS